MLGVYVPSFVFWDEFGIVRTFRKVGFCNPAYKAPMAGMKTRVPLTMPSLIASPVTSEDRLWGVRDAMMLVWAPFSSCAFGAWSLVVVVIILL